MYVYWRVHVSKHPGREGGSRVMLSDYLSCTYYLHRPPQHEQFSKLLEQSLFNSSFIRGRIVV